MEQQIQPRAIVARDAGVLSLGWILAIILCGGVSIFICIGFALVWITQRGTPITRTISPTASPVRSRLRHQLSGLPSARPSATRLAKRRVLASESQARLARYPSSHLSSRFSSRFSLNAPAVPVLPPLPSSSTFRLFNFGRGRHNRTEGDDEKHADGPTPSNSGWLKRDSWFGQPPPPVQDVEAVDTGTAEGRFFSEKELMHDQMMQQRPDMIQFHQQLQQQQQRAQQQQQQGQGYYDPSSLASEDLSAAGRVRLPPPAHFRRLSATDTGLRDILRSTEQRLRDGHSQSPSRTARTSPVRPVSLRTPRSLRNSYSGLNGAGARMNSSPLKNDLSESATWASRPDSTTSIGSAANSLIAAAIEELQLPGGISSPSRLRGREWEASDNSHLILQAPASQSPQRVPPRSPQRNTQRSPTRRRSRDSDASSSLSTLYSEEEGDDNDHHKKHTFDDDPFVEKGTALDYQRQSNHHIFGPRPLTCSSDSAAQYVRYIANQSPPRPHSDPNTSKGGHRDSALIDPKNLGLVLQPPQTRQSEDVRPKGAESNSGAQEPDSADISEDSFVSLSVASVSDSSGPSTPTSTTPKIDVTPKNILSHLNHNNRSRSPTISPVSPVIDDGISDVSSSPYSERDMLSILMGSKSPKRALPIPPTIVTGADGSVITTPLSPPPKGSGERKISGSSSCYDSDLTGGVGATSSGSPSRKSTVRSVKAGGGNRVGLMVAELRRMNSLNSSYSTGSLTSTQAGATDTSNEQRAAAQQSSRTNYLSIGKAAHAKSYSTGGQMDTARGLGSQRRPVAPGVSRLRHQEDADDGKENQGLGLRVPLTRNDSTGSQGLREDSQASNVGMGSPRSSPKPSASVKDNSAKIRPLKPILKKSPPKNNHYNQGASEGQYRPRRDSNTYEKDRYVPPSSPEREPRSKMLRM